MILFVFIMIFLYSRSGGVVRIHILVLYEYFWSRVRRSFRNDHRYIHWAPYFSHKHDLLFCCTHLAHCCPLCTRFPLQPKWKSYKMPASIIWYVSSYAYMHTMKVLLKDPTCANGKPNRYAWYLYFINSSCNFRARFIFHFSLYENSVVYELFIDLYCDISRNASLTHIFLQQYIWTLFISFLLWIYTPLPGGRFEEISRWVVQLHLNTINTQDDSLEAEYKSAGNHWRLHRFLSCVILDTVSYICIWLSLDSSNFCRNSTWSFISLYFDNAFCVHNRYA